MAGKRKPKSPRDRFAANFMAGGPEDTGDMEIKGAKRTDHEGPIHRSIYGWLVFVLPSRALVHHSPNEIDLRGPEIAKAIAKARRLGTVKGWPDLEIVLDGKIYVMEVKAEGNDLDPDQAKLRDDFEENGVPHAVVRSIDDARAALKKWGLETRERGMP
ncbi:VRR-NUC domain-containing protein [uncultured Planktomarina sp.]|uniref:VRR-NUC domain-containing protein n=1 Tax=uncultured Planktomarina sp. TaxID=1538529 RepID=UPI0032602049